MFVRYLYLWSVIWPTRTEHKPNQGENSEMDLPYLQVLLFVPQDLVVLRGPVEKQSRTFQ